VVSSLEYYLLNYFYSVVLCLFSRVMAINMPSVARKDVRLHICIFVVLFMCNTGSVERQLEIYYRNRTDGNLLHIIALYNF
jgi:hypothetical protein